MEVDLVSACSLLFFFCCFLLWWFVLSLLVLLHSPLSLVLFVFVRNTPCKRWALVEYDASVSHRGGSLKKKKRMIAKLSHTHSHLNFPLTSAQVLVMQAMKTKADAVSPFAPSHFVPARHANRPG
jgi:hypothetical protein